MSIDRAPAGFDSSSLTAASFPIKRRGFDQEHVRRYLGEVAGELQRLSASEQALAERLSAAEDRIAHLQVEDVERLTSVLGDEAARLLAAARQSASERLGEAEARASQLLSNAESDALARRDAATADALRSRNEADEYAGPPRRAADEAAAPRLADPRAEAERLLNGAQAALEAEVEAGRQQGATLVREAELMREQILRDLARRRKQLRVQVEQLRVARERLLATHGTVRQALDDIENELSLSLPRARAAALAAGSVVEAEPELTVAELDDQLALARLAGFTVPADDEPLTLTGEIPVLDRVLAEPAAEPAYDSDELVPGEPMPVPGTEIAAPETDEIGNAGSIEHPADEVAEVAPVDREVGDLEVGEPEVGAPEGVAPDAAAEAPNDSEHSDVPIDEAESEPEGADAVVIDLREGATADIDDVFSRIREAREARHDPRPSGVPPAPPVLEPSSTGTAGAVETGAVETGAVAVAVVSTTDDAELLAARDAVLDPFEIRIARLLKKAVNEEQNRVQDAVRRGKGKLDLQTVLGTVEEHAAIYTKPLVAEARQLSIASQQFFDLPQRGDAQATARATDVVAVGLLAPLRAQLERVCSDAVADDERIDAVRAAFRDAKSPRADLVARELTTTVFNSGVAAGAAPGDVRWVVDPAAGCSPDCLDNALAGGVPAGERFPAGQTLAPSHARCRCLIAPAR